MELTHELLLKNGWSKLYSDDPNYFVFGNPSVMHNTLRIHCVEGFTTWLVLGYSIIGEGFNTTEELQEIAKALFKIDLKFE